MNRHQLHSLLVLFLISFFTHKCLANKISETIYSAMPLYTSEFPLTLWLHSDIETCKEVLITAEWSIYSKTIASYIASYYMSFFWVLAWIACDMVIYLKVETESSISLCTFLGKFTSVFQNFIIATSILPLLRTSKYFHSLNFWILDLE